MRASLVHNNWR
ncbi:hypothetical protein CARUB_v100101341mg, partial [Capsella rubella]